MGVLGSLGGLGRASRRLQRPSAASVAPPRSLKAQHQFLRLNKPTAHPLPPFQRAALRLHCLTAAGSCRCLTVGTSRFSFRPQGPCPVRDWHRSVSVQFGPTSPVHLEIGIASGRVFGHTFITNVLKCSQTLIFPFYELFLFQQKGISKREIFKI